MPNSFRTVPHGISVEFRNNFGCGKTLDLDRLFTVTRPCGCLEGNSVTKNSFALGFKLITILLYEKLACYSKVKWSTRNFRWYRSRLYQHEFLEHKQMRLWASFYKETKIIILSGYWIILFTHKNKQKVNEFGAITLFPGTHGVYRVISPESCCFLHFENHKAIDSKHLDMFLFSKTNSYFFKEN